MKNSLARGVNILVFFISAIPLLGQNLPASKSDSLVERGWKYLEENYDPASAERCFRQAISADSNSAKSWSGFGNILLARNHPDSAILCFNKTLDLDSGYFNAYLNLANCYAHLGSLERALSFIRIYQNRYPDSTGWISTYVAIYESFRKFDSAMYYCNLYMEREPGFRASLMRGDLFLTIGKPEDGYNDLKQALLIKPQNPWILGKIAHCFLLLNQPDSCEYYLNLLLAGYPGDPTGLYILASLQLSRGQFDNALATANKGWEQDSSSNMFLEVKANIYRIMKNWDMAVEVYEKMLVNSPSELRILGNIAALISLKNARPQEVATDSSGMVKFTNIKSTDLKSLDKKVINEKSVYFYPALLSRFRENPRSLGTDDWFMLYYGTTTRPDYSPYGMRGFGDDLMPDNDSAIIATVPAMIEKDFSKLRLYFMLISAYMKSGQYEKAYPYFFNLYAIVSSIVATGDDKNQNTSWIVVSPTDEYALMDLLGYEPEGQALSEYKGHWFDSQHCLFSNGTRITLWFNIDKPYNHLKKMFHN